MRSSPAADRRPTLQHLGAAGTVTGSKHLVRSGHTQVLLDCGLFQGLKDLRRRNRSPLPLDPERLSAVVLSHAHIDHSGALPLLVKQGFRGPIHCTPGTADLLPLLLLDAAHLQEEEAEFANRHGYSKHKPALPLYSVEEAAAVLPLVVPQRRGQTFAVADGVHAMLRHAGHILGAATVQLDVDGPPRRTIVFSGDLGRWGRPILHDPELVPEADVVLVEATYGDRVHAPGAEDELARVVNRTVERGGVLIVPAFAVGRTQELIWTLRELEEAGRIPVLPVIVDSPMASNVTEIYLRHPDEHDVQMRAVTGTGQGLATRDFRLVRTATESRAAMREPGPRIVIAGSGMATGGRVLHHLRRHLPDENATVLLSGFQAAGTRGRSLLDGARSVRLFGEDVTVQAEVVALDGLSAHADRDELMRWLRGFRRAPRLTSVVHGEPEAAESLRARIADQLGWPAEVARQGAVVAL